MPAAPPHVVDVIPFKERYSATAAGAIALCVDQMAAVTAARTTVLGRACADPLPGGRFRPVRSFFLTYRFAAAYVMGWEALFYFEGVLRALKREKPDIIQVHNRPLLAVMLQRAFPKVPVFLFLHNDPMEMRELRPPKNIGSQLKVLAGVVALSGWIENRLYEAVPKVPRGLVHRIGNVVDCPAAHEDEAGLFAAKEKLILFVGRITGGKGPLAFAEAMVRLLDDYPGWRALCLGGFRMGTTDCSKPDGYQQQFLDTVARHQRLEFLGPRPFPETMEQMRKAAILAVPSRHHEAFARVGVEGMFAGAAMIVCKKGGALPEVVPEASGALHIDDATTAEIEAATRRLLDDDAERTRRARLGRAYALDHYAPASVGRRIDALYTSAQHEVTR
ncbi:glycosyltransferase family 4 protein [Zavarzinia compransoris]|uniref:Glycosyltransferase family 1 protein n=1 Tax=Zavarzinia compransoris TaxID=1264899 RepID=A0A317E165_9PROT|nr:glycosyltransferase family 4 protein [Zavarzinia compransoris]PWR20808.1 hypothetical protein DKG75_12515 [Zavarzinia compransoris]TDP44356.1 glycosyltransferase involved in cell wall biosynthesis [Zavarzinia compransoris]